MKKLITDNFNKTHKELIALIERLTEAELNARPNANTWSIAMVCHHIALVEFATIKAVRYGLKEEKDTKSEQKDLSIMLDRTKKFSAPKVVEPGGGPFELQELVEMLNNARDSLNRTLDSMGDQSILEEKSVFHPALGLLPLNQWIEVLPLHEERHLEQIKDLLGK
ncbi:DinB family protein [Ornithinibacillus halotolerans]|uniref:PadR family transcriptional regulator n=1 Tax=Ornithinibacillus halotolerans TaxID=1274357 RepID=A0A916RV80_9BACI|nr:DinB family protein [Ornithinibacillus halotolerans]GGA71380.1 PadR family transcriptional regulator [Ornithinibacillus halotolerans]